MSPGDIAQSRAVEGGDVGLRALEQTIAAIPDPEVPVIGIGDLGVLRSVEEIDGEVVVTITPTYSGCPAMYEIERLVSDALVTAGVKGRVRTVYSPAWTTDWITEQGRRNMRQYGIAPPRPVETGTTVSLGRVGCPNCRSTNTELISRFGSTACKSLYRCLDCLEPFDHFKEH